MSFTNEQLERYSRHIILKEVGAKGQKKLLNAKVLIIGAGGLGAPVAMYLAAAGVGTIGIADADEVDLSNLQRQVIHTTADLGKAKVKSAKETMQAINPDVKVNTYRKFITSENIMDIIKDYDFIIDGTDSRIRRRRMLYRPVSRQESSEPWQGLLEVFRRWKLSSTLSEKVIFLREGFSPMML